MAQTDAKNSASPPVPSVEELLKLHSQDILARCTDFGLAHLVVERGGAIVGADAASIEMLGYSLDELRAFEDVSVLIAVEQREIRMRYRQLRLQHIPPPNPMHLTVIRGDGSRLPTEVVHTLIDDGRYTILTVRDASALASRDQIISWYSNLVERMPLGVMIARRVNTDDGLRLELIAANRAASSAFSMDLEARVGEMLMSIFPTFEAMLDRERILAILGTDRIEHLSDTVVGDPAQPAKVFKRVVVALPHDAVALLVEDVTRSAIEDLHRRALLERIVELSDSERRKIALGIHDEPLQQIAGAALLVGQMRRPDRAPREDWLAEVDRSLRQAMDLLRRLIFDLSPPELIQSGLATALSNAADYIFAGTGVRVEVERVDDAPIPEQVADTAFRIAVEALTNARKHANCSSVRVRILAEHEHLSMIVIDDGTGFDERASLGHFGFSNIRDRAEAIGGTIRIITGSAGTTVSTRLPLRRSRQFEAPELTTSIRELDFERATIALERDSLRESLTEMTRASKALRKRMDMFSELGPFLRNAPAAIRNDVACEFFCQWFADGAALRRPSADEMALHRVASFHRDAHQLSFLNQFLFVDRSNNLSNVHMVFRTGEPVMIDRRNGRWSLDDGPTPPEGPIEVHSAILVPVRKGVEIVGVLTCCRDQNLEGFTGEDVDLVRSLADALGSLLA